METTFPPDPSLSKHDLKQFNWLMDVAWTGATRIRNIFELFKARAERTTTKISVGKSRKYFLTCLSLWWWCLSLLFSSLRWKNGPKKRDHQLFLKLIIFESLANQVLHPPLAIMFVSTQAMRRVANSSSMLNASRRAYSSALASSTRATSVQARSAAHSAGGACACHACRPFSAAHPASCVCGSCSAAKVCIFSQITSSSYASFFMISTEGWVQKCFSKRQNKFYGCFQIHRAVDESCLSLLP